MIAVSIAFALIFELILADEIPGNLTDVSVCKLSHLGLEFMGDISKSESFVRCQSWTSNEPHPIPDSIKDSQFSDFSRKRAKNYCRNPNRDPTGPWCYTMNTDLKFDTCGIPLCSLSECKLTGPGMEYSGTLQKSISDRNCLRWTKNRKVKEKGAYHTYNKFNKNRFPGQEIKKTCRNPNGDLGGPWCFVENEDTDQFEREYCDVPFCHEHNCVVFTAYNKNYTHWTDFNETLTKFDFGVKLWDSDSFLNASAKLALSLLAQPMSGHELELLGVGLEIVISNSVSALTFGNKDQPEYEETPGIIQSNNFTMFTLSWGAPFLTLSLQNKMKPIFLAEYKTKNLLMGFKKDKFSFYSAMGTNIQWTFPFCEDDFDCDVQTTVGGPHFQQFWGLLKRDVGFELQFHLRAFHSVYLLFVQSPTVKTPNIRLALQPGNRPTKVVANLEDGTSIVIKEINLGDLLNYWEFREYSISFAADSMYLYWTRSIGIHAVFEIQHELFKTLRFFSPASDTIAHWTFFCIPPESSKPKPALPPHCALNKEEENYSGKEDVSSVSGHPCLPWSSKLVPENSTLENFNYCRDVKNEKKGTYCYIFTPEKIIEKIYCRLRKCKSLECRMAGTGNDYVGSLSKTRTNRSCDFWFEDAKKHQPNDAFKNESLYPDLTLENVKNSCRNPSRDIAGPWCYTTDEKFSKDLCNVRDCDRPEENILIITKNKNRLVYILPEWKLSGFEFGLKQWNPDFGDGVVFTIYSLDRTKFLNLTIGADNNEKIILVHGPNKEQKTFPHLISSGKWTDFWLLMKKTEISLGFKGIPNNFFEYKPKEGFDPMFLSIGTIQAHPMGFFIKRKNCLTENTTTSAIEQILPIGIYNSEKKKHKSFSLGIRGIGIGVVTLMALPNTSPNYTLVFDTKTHTISLNLMKQTLKKTQVTSDIFIDSNWTVLSINFTEHYISVNDSINVIFSYNSTKPLVWYWFSVGVINGWLLWSANCPTLDIDGPPRDGGWSGWSTWECTVTCGGGEGFRTRTCTNPTPNVMGNLCLGSHISTGLCNDFVCGDLSPSTIDKIRENLQSQQNSFVINEGRTIIIENDAEALKLIHKESSNAYYEWSLNGILIEPKGELFFENDNVMVREATLKDSGVYVCMLYRVNKKRLVIRVASLAIITKDYSIKTRATRSLVISCQSVVLGYIYGDLSLTLYLNKGVYKDYGVTMLAAMNAEHFNHLNISHSGDWKCVVEQKDLGLSWVTNYLRIQVKKAPNFYTNLMEDEFTKPIFGWMESETTVMWGLFFIVSSVIMLILLFLFIYFKFCTIGSKW